MLKSNKFLDNKRILVIGGTGSWGNELVRQIIQYSNPNEIRIFSRGEHKQVEMRHKYSYVKNLRFIVGDIRDQEAVDLAIKGVDVVFNLAALKHVSVCEENVWEAIQTNVFGVHNVIVASMRHAVDVVVQVSTDKAVDPLNLYGFTKGCAEKLITSANYSSSKPENTKFVCVRGGNVLSTTGSVVPLFKYLIQKYNKVTITNKDMSRYFIRVSHAIGLVLKAVTKSMGGEIFVMKMPGVKITDLAQVMIGQLGNKSTKTEYIGIRPGEKLYEVLVSKNESRRTVEDGEYYIILPDEFFNNSLNKKYKSHTRMSLEEYNSKNTHQLDRKALFKLLEEDDWLDEDRSEPLSSVFSPYRD